MTSSWERERRPRDLPAGGSTGPLDLPAPWTSPSPGFEPLPDPSYSKRGVSTGRGENVGDLGFGGLTLSTNSAPGQPWY